MIVEILELIGMFICAFILGFAGGSVFTLKHYFPKKKEPPKPPIDVCVYDEKDYDEGGGFHIYYVAGEDPLIFQVEVTDGDLSCKNMISMDDIRGLPSYMRDGAIRNMRDQTVKEFIQTKREEKSNGTDSNTHYGNGVDPNLCSGIEAAKKASDPARDTWRDPIAGSK